MSSMSAPSLAASAARVLLVRVPANEVRRYGRDTVAPRDPNAPKVRRYRLARLQLNGGPRAARGSSTCAAATTERGAPAPVSPGCGREYI
jgi:hypothetical protein